MPTAGTTTESKIKDGSLLLGGVDFSCQPTNVKVTPPNPPSGSSSDDSTEVLCGNVLASDSGGDNSWRLAFTQIQDFTDPDGLIQYSWDNQGDEVPFTWAPRGAAGPSFAGTVQVWPIELGGDVNKRLTSDAEWTITSGKPARTDVASWQATTPYVLNDYVKLSGGAVLQCTTAGTSDATEPTAPATVGGTVTDGDVVWTRVS